MNRSSYKYNFEEVRRLPEFKHHTIKKQFSSEEADMVVKEKGNYDKGNKTAKLSKYKCRYCSYYHITSTAKQGDTE